jgi:hypothetical protein
VSPAAVVTPAATRVPPSDVIAIAGGSGKTPTLYVLTRAQV